MKSISKRTIARANLSLDEKRLQRYNQRQGCGVSFSFSMGFWLFLVLPLLVALFGYGDRRRREARERFGLPKAIEALSTLNSRRRRWSRLLLLFSSALLVIAVSGPRWGRGESGVVVGRDLMIVLDLSKSMLADDMRSPDGREKERWQAAQAGIRDLVASLKQRGGHRLGLVLFASRPWIVCPLTTDYDHFLMRLDEFDPAAPPPEIIAVEEEPAPSGTRIGAALAEAVKRHDARFVGYQDILLLSDGDDPAADRDVEIKQGINAARDAHIPVNTVGIGDPNNATTIDFKRPNNDIELLGPTRLMEEPLKEIAQKTGGLYLPAQRDRPDLKEFFSKQIEPRPTREIADEWLPQPKSQTLWFILAASLLLLVSWWLDR